MAYFGLGGWKTYWSMSERPLWALEIIQDLFEMVFVAAVIPLLLSVIPLPIHMHHPREDITRISLMRLANVKTTLSLSRNITLPGFRGI